MAAVTWPVNLPAPLLSGYGYQQGRKVRRNAVQGGPPRYVLQDENAPALFAATWILTRLEFQVFEAWFRLYLNHGSTSFLIDLAVGAGSRQHECYLLGGEYQVSSAGLQMRVTAQLEATELVQNTDEEAESLIQLHAAMGSAEPAILDSLAALTEITLPAEIPA